MQLVNSYLAEVAQHLPRDQRSDIVSELRDDITEQLEALAEQAGRVPGVADERAVLGRLGHPLKVAGSFAPRRYLIGPGLYPAYLKTLRTSIGLVLATALFIWVAIGSDSSVAYGFKGLLGQALSLSFWVVVVVTLVFLSLEATGDKLGWYHHWTPDQLKSGVSPLDYGDTVINLLTESLFLLWWNSLLSMSWGANSQWLAGLTLSSTWGDLFWPLNVVVGGLLLLHVFVLVRGNWSRWSACFELALNCLFIGLLVTLLVSGALVASSDASSVEPVAWVDRTLRILMVGVGLFTLWDSKLAYERWRRSDLNG